MDLVSYITLHMLSFLCVLCMLEFFLRRNQRSIFHHYKKGPSFHRCTTVYSFHTPKLVNIPMVSTLLQKKVLTVRCLQRNLLSPCIDSIFNVPCEEYIRNYTWFSCFT